MTEFETYKGKENVILISIYDKETKNFWHLHFLIDGNEDYLLNEFNNNPEINVSHSFNSNITDWDIDSFSFEIETKLSAVKTGLTPQFYTEVEKKNGTKSFFAYTRTEKDTIKHNDNHIK